MRVILDTNILVSALKKPQGREALVLLLALRGQFQLPLSPTVLAEYKEVLNRPRLKLNPHEIQATMANIGRVGELVYPTVRLKISNHESDNRFYECAAAAQADYLVTGNRRHFPKDLPPTKIVNARQLLDVLGEQNS